LQILFGAVQGDAFPDEGRLAGRVEIRHGDAVRGVGEAEAAKEVVRQALRRGMRLGGEGLAIG
jgi:hypothetical protein